jgi:pimeloyl-ACP methyl ester carboxylesterase
MSISTSAELFAPVSPGIELCYQTFGDPDDEPLLLVMGLGGPMTWWDPELCSRLAEAGFFVVRYDNRDTGRSTRLEGRVTRSALVKAFLGRRGSVPYTLEDMAGDAFGLMDHLGWASAHIAGVSMGGMIVQTMALAQPRRVRSMTSIMSTLGRRSVGWQHPALLPMLIAERKAGRAAYVESSAKLWKVIGSPAYPQDDAKVRSRAEETFDRGVSASGVMRQMLAILSQPNRSRALASLRMPTAVVHGTADKMVHISGGRATARAIPGAELLVIDGMGHDMPEELFGTFTDLIRRTADRAGQQPTRSTRSA